MVKFFQMTVLALVSAASYVTAAPAGNDTASTALDHWICSCFKPAYDKGCCDLVKGTMDDGNVCDIPGRGDIYKVYESCCTSIQGTYKCK